MVKLLWRKRVRKLRLGVRVSWVQVFWWIIVLLWLMALENLIKAIKSMKMKHFQLKMLIKSYDCTLLIFRVALISNVAILSLIMFLSCLLIYGSENMFIPYVSLRNWVKILQNLNCKYSIQLKKTNWTHVLPSQAPLSYY